jgi:hypothetical protein
MLDICAREVRSGTVGDEPSTHDDANDESGKRQLGYTERPSALLIEGDWEL